MSKWFQPRKPNEITPLPWLAPEAISYLENIIQPDWEVIEHGSGGSTLWFAQRCRHVTAYESDPDWLDVVKKNAPENVKLVSLGELAGIGLYDLVLIDGEPVKLRAGWLIAAQQIIKPGGWVVLDNANRPEYKAEREGLAEYADLVHTVDSNSATGCTYLTTEFWRMK